MARNDSAPAPSAEAGAWALTHFGDARLQGPASFKRLVRFAAMSLEHAGQSIPKSCGRWADILGAYRLLSNGAVDPHEIQRPHRDQTREACDGRGVVLAVADITDLDYTDHPKTTGLGKLGDGRQQGLQQHTVLAVEPEGGVLGILDQRLVHSARSRPRASRGVRVRAAGAWRLCGRTRCGPSGLRRRAAA